MPDNYKELMSLKSRLLLLEVEQFQNRYRRLDSVYSYFQTILEILQQDSFLALDPALSEKIYSVSMALAFRYPKNVEIQALRKKVFHELASQERKLQTERDDQIQQLIQKERTCRFIPDSISLQENHILEMYKHDFQNYTNIFYQFSAEEEMNLFYYLATVHKLCTDYPAVMESLKVVTTFTILRFEQQSLPTAELLEYIHVTNQRLFDKKKQSSKTKVISISERTGHSKKTML